MRLQDLKDDVAWAREPGNPIPDFIPDAALSRVFTLARRIADLYQTCAACGGSGTQPGMGALLWQCDRCEGMGIEAVAGEFRYAAMALARYLFGED